MTRYQPSPAMVVACIALVVAMGGTGYAAITLPKNSVKARQIATNAVGAAEIRSGAVRSAEIRDGALLRTDFKAGEVPVGPQGPQGPQGLQGVKGDPGEAGFGRAFATVLSSTPTPEFHGDTKNVTAVARPAGAPVGVYCLTLAAGISPVDTHAVASPEWSASTGSDLFVYASNEVDDCPEGTLEVRTYDLPGPALSDDVSFNIIVP